MATFWEIAAQSVDHMFSLCFCYNFSYFRFGVEGWIWVQIASFPDLCILFTFSNSLISLLNAQICIAFPLRRGKVAALSRECQ